MNVDLESWQAIAGGVALLVVGVHGKWEQYRTRKKAEKAVELSQPTGNGFAKRVTDALTRIEETQKKDSEMLYEHLRAHANSDVMNSPRRVARDLTEL